MNATEKQPRTLKTVAILAHVSAFTGLLIPFVGGVIGTGLVWLFKRKENPFVEDQATEALNFNISILIYELSAALLSMILPVSAFLMLTIYLFWLIFTFIAILKSSQGHFYRYPLSLQLIKKEHLIDL